MGRSLGRLAYLLGWRRRVVEDQLGRAFPDRGADWVRRTAKRAFEHVGQEALLLPRLARGGLDEVRRRIERFDGRDELEDAFRQGRGVILVAGHFGNWEFAGSCVATIGLPIDAVMQGLKNRRLTRFVQRMRERLGMGMIDRAEAWDEALESLAAGRIVAFVADQDARKFGVFVPFLGRPASTHRSPALLALRTGAPLFVGGATRLESGRYDAWAVRLEPPAGVGAKRQVFELTRAWSAELERRVRLYPEQYFWHHRRWKTLPAEPLRAESGIRNSVADETNVAEAAE